MSETAVIKKDSKEVAILNLKAFKTLKELKEQGYFKNIVNENSSIDLDDVIAVIGADSDSRLSMMEELLKGVFTNPDEAKKLTDLLTQSSAYSIDEVLCGSIDPKPNQLISAILRLWKIFKKD